MVKKKWHVEEKDDRLLLNGKSFRELSKGHCRDVFLFPRKGIVVKVDLEALPDPCFNQTKREVDFYFKLCLKKDRKFFPQPLAWGTTSTGRFWAIFEYVPRTRRSLADRPELKRLLNRYRFTDIYGPSDDWNWHVSKKTGRVCIYDYGLFSTDRAEERLNVP